MVFTKAVIGNSLIAKLKPKEKQYDVRDANLKGFLIRVTPVGKMSYIKMTLRYAHLAPEHKAKIVAMLIEE